MNKFNYINPNLLYKKVVKEVDLNTVRPSRAGVIMYTKINNELYFGLGIDSASQEITDFGGGISYKNDKNVILGALREFKEETLGIFGHIDYLSVLEAPVIYNSQLLVIFKYVDLDPIVINTLFRNAYQQQLYKTPEVSNILWMTKTEFSECIRIRGKMFFRLQTFLQKAGNFYWLL